MDLWAGGQTGVTLRAAPHLMSVVPSHPISSSSCNGSGAADVVAVGRRGAGTVFRFQPYRSMSRPLMRS